MGRYTVLGDPVVDQTIEEHLQRAIEAVLIGMAPHAIILRGSFGRGEGSVVVSNSHVHFLSDYEIDVATFSPFHRPLFRDISRQLTTELGVETSLRWVRPDYMVTARVGPLPMGAAPITISLYESRYGSRILYGQDVIDTSPPIDPCDVRTESAAFLLLNRMAESLSYMHQGEDGVVDDWTAYYWINKTILACAESLLLLWGQYHFSYAERGRRFAAMPNDHVDFMGKEGAILCDLVERATAFKLRPRLSLYPEPVQVAWTKIVPICDKVFRHVAMEAFDLRFTDYSQFPHLFLRHAIDTQQDLPILHRGALALLDVYKCLRVGRLSRALLSPCGLASSVYAVVPPMFVSRVASGNDLSTLLTEIRQRLATVFRIEAQALASDAYIEWDLLRQQVLWAWRNFCYR